MYTWTKKKLTLPAWVDEKFQGDEEEEKKVITLKNCAQISIYESWVIIWIYEL